METDGTDWVPQDANKPREMSKSLEMLTMGFSFAAAAAATRLIFSTFSRLCHESMVQGSWKGFKRCATRRKFCSYLSRHNEHLAAKHANLLDIESFSFFVFLPPSGHFFFISGFNYCHVVCEVNTKRLLMIYCIGFEEGPSLLFTMHYRIESTFQQQPQKYGFASGARRHIDNISALASAPISIFHSTNAPNSFSIFLSLATAPSKLIYHSLWFYLCETRKPEKNFFV